MVHLFQNSHINVVEYIKCIYEEGELDEDSTIRKFRQVQKEGNRDESREIKYMYDKAYKWRELLWLHLSKYKNKVLNSY